MTIDEAIAKYRYKAMNYKETTNVAYGLECEQIVEWLRELRILRAENAEQHCELQSIYATMDLHEEEIRAKVIDKFAEKLKDGSLDILTWLMSRQEVGHGTTNGELHEKWLNKIDDVAEQMKGV